MGLNSAEYLSSEAAMNQAERMAAAGGYLDPDRTDGRVFFENDAPSDPFTTERTRSIQRDMQSDETQHAPEYSVSALSANGNAHLDLTKEWGQDQHAHLIIPQPNWATARANVETAHDLLDEGDLQGAITLIELAGIEAGVIDPRLFTEGPPDPFTTIRERELAQAVDVVEITSEQETMYRELVAQAARDREANATLEGAAWFEATFEKSDTELLQPVDNTVNYAVVVQDADPWRRELIVEKYWREPNGYVGSQSVYAGDMGFGR